MEENVIYSYVQDSTEGAILDSGAENTIQVIEEDQVIKRFTCAPLVLHLCLICAPLAVQLLFYVSVAL